MRMTTSVTLNDVARRAGVSRATASRVVRGDVCVTAAKTQAVRKAVEELGYTPNSAARALVTRRTGTVALIIPEPDETVFSDPFLARVVRQVSRSLDQVDIQLVMVFADTEVGGRRTATFLRNGAVDGAIVISHHQLGGQVGSILSSRVPVVFIGRPVGEGVPASWVDVDNVHGGRLAARRLVARGCRRPAVITGALDMVAAQDRLRGCREVTEANGLELLVVEGDFSAASGRAAGNCLAPRVLGGGVDGVFACSDVMAVEAVQALARHGICVPDDLPVVSYDDSPEAASVSPSLTSVTNPPTALGQAAVDMLLSVLEDTWDGRPLTLPIELVLRDSA